VLTLVLDTATAQGRFALAADGRLLAYQPHNLEGRITDAILPVIASLTASAGRHLTEVALVGVTAGPGSFTGVRVGVATAKTLAWALGAELAAVSTLAAMAADLLADHPRRTLAVPVLDARRGEIFAALYRRQDGWVEELAAPACLPPDAWWQRLTALVDDLDGPVYGGNGVSLLVREGEHLRPELTGRGLPAARAWSAAHPATARTFAIALATAKLRAQALVSPFALTPWYLRGADAEVLRQLDATPTRPTRDVAIHTGEPPPERAP
jgi:tRNA threonylcarbamoyladenosine biosynthesis protein TsaB